MKLKQKVILWLGLVLVIAMGLYAPWIQEAQSRYGRVGSSLEIHRYHWVFSPPPAPTDVRSARSRINIPVLWVQWGLVALTVAVFYWTSMTATPWPAIHISKRVVVVALTSVGAVVLVLLSSRAWAIFVGYRQHALQERLSLMPIRDKLKHYSLQVSAFSPVPPRPGTAHVCDIVGVVEAPLRKSAAKSGPLTPDQVWKDPEFHALPLEDRRSIISTVDAEFRKLPRQDQELILRDAAHKISTGLAPGEISRIAGEVLGLGWEVVEETPIGRLHIATVKNNSQHRYDNLRFVVHGYDAAGEQIGRERATIEVLYPGETARIGARFDNCAVVSAELKDVALATPASGQQ